MDSADIPFGPPPSETPHPETVPLVVPDVTHWRSGYEKSVSLGYQCHGVKANGQRCGWIAGKVDSYCFIHDPTITKEQRNERKRGKKIRLPSKLADGQEPKTIKEVLLIASARLDAYIGRFGGASTSEVEQTICDMIRTFVSVYKCSSDSEAVGLSHWSRKQA